MIIIAVIFLLLLFSRSIIAHSSPSLSLCYCTSGPIPVPSSIITAHLHLRQSGTYHLPPAPLISELYISHNTYYRLSVMHLLSLHFWPFSSFFFFFGIFLSRFFSSWFSPNPLIFPLLLFLCHLPPPPSLLLFSSSPSPYRSRVTGVRAVWYHPLSVNIELRRPAIEFLRYQTIGGVQKSIFVSILSPSLHLFQRVASERPPVKSKLSVITISLSFPYRAIESMW